jgi:uncharacterized protein (TIGR02996 family)
MLDSNEAALLQAIAEDYEENTTRLVFADWLEEHGKRKRAEFIRLQCERALAPDAESSRALRMREHELLAAHGEAWRHELGLPVEEVYHERGLIARMRLSQWQEADFLDPTCLQQLATLTELDLSGLGLADQGLIAFAKRARLPALRKLILSDNGITNAGASALTAATGLPRLDTIYLFQNPLDSSARTMLQRSSFFSVKTLDLGERAEGYCLSPGEVEVARREYIRTYLMPVVSRYFATYERLRSAMLCVAQYWADEADDAVHGRLIVSELFEPVLEGVDEDKSHADPNLPNTYIKRQYGEGSSSDVSLWEAGAGWDDNSGAIPLWAAFAPEGGSQEYTAIRESYAPAVMFYRHAGYEILPRCRPHLDGVRPEWDREV